MTPREPSRGTIGGCSDELGYPMNGRLSKLTIATSKFLKARENELGTADILVHSEEAEQLANAFFNEHYDPDETTESNAEHFWGENSRSRGQLFWPQHSHRITDLVSRIICAQRSGRINSGRAKGYREQSSNLGQSQDKVSDDSDSNLWSDAEIIPRGTFSRPYRPNLDSGSIFRRQMMDYTSHDSFPGDFSDYDEEISPRPRLSGALRSDGLFSQSTTPSSRESTSISHDVSDDEQTMNQPAESSPSLHHKKRQKLNTSTPSLVAQYDSVSDLWESDTTSSQENLLISPQPGRSSPLGAGARNSLLVVLKIRFVEPNSFKAPPHQITPLGSVSPPAQQQQGSAYESLPQHSMPCLSLYQPRTSFGQVNKETSLSNSANFLETPLQCISSARGSQRLGTVIESNIQPVRGEQGGASVQQTESPQAGSSTLNGPLPDPRVEETKINAQPAYVTAATHGSQQGLSVHEAESRHTHWSTPNISRLQTGTGETAQRPIILDDLPPSSPHLEKASELIPRIKLDPNTPTILAEAAIENAEETYNAQVALFFQFLVYDTSDGRFKKNHTKYLISELPDNFDFEASTIAEFFEFYKSREVSRAPERLISLEFSFPVELRSRYICPVIKCNAHERDFKGVKDQILEAVDVWATHYPTSDSMIIEVVIPGWQPAPLMNVRKAVPVKWSYKSLGRGKIPL